MSTLDRWYAMKQERDTLRRAQRNLTNSYNALSQQLAEVRTELASHAWTVSPAMADAQIHQLNLKIIGLEETIAIHTACATALKQQLAQQLQQLGAITLALNDVGCPLDESGSDFILRQAQQLAQATQLSDSRRMVMEDQATMLNEYVQQLATVTSALDILCQAIEQGEQDEDYLRRRAVEGRMALAQGRGA